MTFLTAGTSQRPILLLLSGGRRVVDKVLALGLDVVHFQAPSMYDPALDPLCLHTEKVDFLDGAAAVRLARELHQRFRFVGVVSNHEPASVAAELIAHDLGLRAPGKNVAATLRDKVRTRRMLDTNPRLRAPWAQIETVDDLAMFADLVGFPVILKPRDGSASIGVIRVDRQAELASAWQRVRATLRNQHRYHEVLPVTGYLAEPFFTGTEYSVESFTRDGKHEICAVVGKSIDAAFVETGHVTPPTDLTPAQRAAIDELVFDVLDTVGLLEGPAHTEVIVGADGVHLVESHARTGGDEIPALVRLVTGWDAEAGMLAHFAGLPAPAALEPQAPAAAKAYLTCAEPGRISSIDGLGEAGSVPGVRTVTIWAHEGDEVRPARASWDRLGEVIAVGPTPQDAQAAARRARDLIAIGLEPA